jgi:hypothetical protein
MRYCNTSICVYFPFLDRVLTLSPRPSLPAAFASLCPYHLRSQPSTWTGWGECTDADQVEMAKYAYVDLEPNLKELYKPTTGNN